MVMVAVRCGCVSVGGWWEGWCDVIFNITEGGLELIFFVLEWGVLSKFLPENSSFSAPPPDNYCTVPKQQFNHAITYFETSL